MSTAAPRIEHNPGASRFEAHADGLMAESTYRIADGVMKILHTGVPKELEGRGIAGQLVSAALAYAREQGLKVKPLCSYAAGYMQRHPETQDLLA